MLGTEQLTWRDLRIFVMGAARESAYVRSVAGEAAAWGPVEHLLASLVDVMQLANWQRAGDRNARRPEALQRPGVKAPGQQLGSDPIPVSQFDDWWENN